MTDTALLKFKMARAGKTVADLAAKMGISPAALRNRINNRTEFTAREMQCIINVLFLSAYDANAIFLRGAAKQSPPRGKPCIPGYLISEALAFGEGTLCLPLICLIPRDRAQVKGGAYAPCIYPLPGCGRVVCLSQGKRSGAAAM